MRVTVGTIRRLIREVATLAKLGELEAMGAGLYKCGDTNIRYILYDARTLEFQAARLRTRDALTTAIEKAMIGTITCQRSDGNAPYGAFEVTQAAAVKGYGPTLYDIVMADTGALMSDRHEVTPAARRVWHTYKDKRSNVRSLPIDDKTLLKHLRRTPDDESDDGEMYEDERDPNPPNPNELPDDALNYVYVPEFSANIGTLLSNHERCIALFDRIGSVDDIILSVLRNEAWQFFNFRWRGIV